MISISGTGRSERVIESCALVKSLLDEAGGLGAEEFMQDYQKNSWTAQAEEVPNQHEFPFSGGGVRMNAQFYFDGQLIDSSYGTFTRIGLSNWLMFLNWLQRRKPFSRQRYSGMYEWVAEANGEGFSALYNKGRKRVKESDEEEIEFSPEDVANVVAAGMGPEALARYVRSEGERSDDVSIDVFVKEFTNVDRKLKLHVRIVQAVIKKAIVGLSSGPEYKIWMQVWVVENTVTKWDQSFLPIQVPLGSRHIGNINFQQILRMLGWFMGVGNKSAEELPALIERVMKDYTLKG